ncbi:hypothetical protein PLCT1_01274 [Planctomycetaceae bacterium]|nr:hypothetical protein PLCT1_01274 [Planctomycetaceae bacterium]
MKYLAPVLAALFLTMSCSAPPKAQEKEKPNADSPWQDWAKRADLEDADIKRLERDKVLVTNQTFRQSFQAYIGSALPVFITSDAVLNGFHVLFEESILRLETANARQVRPVLLKIWEGLKEAGKDIKGKPELLKAAQFRAKAVIAVALKLYGEKVVFPKDIEEAAEEQVKLIVAGNTVGKPKWLGEPDAGFMAIDYARFTPRGFYTRNEALQRHFRALSWLQAIPFRVEKDEELLAICLIGDTIEHKRWKGDSSGLARFDAAWRCFAAFLGTGDDWDLLELRDHVQELPKSLDGKDLEARRNRCLSDTRRGGGRPELNDQLRFVPDDPTAAAEPNYRIISAYRLPDAVLFARTTDPRKFQRALPTGLEVAALLGSKFAANQLERGEKSDLAKTIEAAKPLLGEKSVYGSYLNCLSALVDEPETDAPKFLSGEAWQAKQCNALLAGWAQMRHTWALQAKFNEHYFGMALGHAGFVEPEPEFFARMSTLLELTEELLLEAAAVTPDPLEVAGWLREYAALIARLKLAENVDKAIDELRGEESETVERGLTALEHLAPMKYPGYGDKERGKKIVESVAKAEEIASQLEAGTFKDAGAIDAVFKESNADLRPMWKELKRTVRQIESLAHKQLRKVDFSEADEEFLREFGEQLAGVMLYGGNSWLGPRDDSPRAVNIFNNPNTGERLHVGIDRARAIYVLYPWDGKEILCRGAVMPYHEFTSKEPLTDVAFMGLLDSDKRPKVPEWSKKFVWDKGIGAAMFPKGH